MRRSCIGQKFNSLWTEVFTSHLGLATLHRRAIDIERNRRANVQQAGNARLFILYN